MWPDSGELIARRAMAGVHVFAIVNPHADWKANSGVPESHARL